MYTLAYTCIRQRTYVCTYVRMYTHIHTCVHLYIQLRICPPPPPPSGLDRWTYWTIMYIYNYALYAVVIGIVFVASFIFQIRLVTQVCYAWMGLLGMNVCVQMLSFIFTLSFYLYSPCPDKCSSSDIDICVVGTWADNTILLVQQLLQSVSLLMIVVC